MNFSEFRSWFDGRFSIELEKNIQTFSSYSESSDVHDIAEYARLLAKDGKRFRPYMVFLASGFSKEEAEDHFLLFASVELLHLFALIHDDIMDKAEYRHSVSCAHVVFGKKYGEHTGNAVAILLGDLVFSWAYNALTQYTVHHKEYRDRLYKEFHTLVSEVTHGQLLDIISPVQTSLPKEMIVQKMSLKTARYSFVQPLRLGFIASGDTKEDSVFAEAFGLPLGVAFQIQDDLIDTLPTTQTGKSRFTDIQTKQQTLLSWYFFEKASLLYKQQFSSFYGKILSKDDEKSLDILLRESGAYEYIQQESASYIEIAKQAIETHPEKEKWEDVISLIEHRKK